MILHPEISDINKTGVQQLAGQSTDIGPVIKSALHTIEKPEISRLVEQALKASKYIDSSFIRVLARGSRITLCGRVRSWFQKEEAGKVAKLASGNLNIINDIAISHFS